MNYIQLEKLFYKNKIDYEKTYEARFHNESTIHISIMINENKAFISNSNEILNLTSKIYKADKQLSQLINKLPSIALEEFTKRSLVDEIKLSNDIEGVHSTRKEISDLLKPANRDKIQKRLYGLVQKYSMLLSDEAIVIENCSNIRAVYNDLVLKEVVTEDPRNTPDGVYFRKDAVSVQGPDLRVIHNGVNPEEQIIAYMDESLRLINDNNINKLISVAAFHYLFGYIHPFYDGNGRLSRFISSYFLSKELHPLIGLSLSYTIKKQIKLYYKAFSIVNDKKNKGDITPFVIIFLDLVHQAIERLNITLQDKIGQLEFYCKFIESYCSDEKIFNMIFILVQNTLFGEEGMTVDEIADIIHVSVPTIRNYIKSLDLNLFVVTKRGNRKLYDIDLDMLATD